MDSSLNLRLSNTNLGLGSKKELNLLGGLDLVPTKNEVVAVGGSGDEPKRTEEITSLGLHQKAHMTEREWTERVMEEIKRARTLSTAETKERVRARLYGTLGISNHLPLGRSPLGINIRSPMISKPPFSGRPVSGYGLERWPRTLALQNPSQSWAPRGVFQPQWPIESNPRPIAYSAGTRIRSDGSKEIIFQETVSPSLRPNPGPVAYGARARTRSDVSKEIIFHEEIRP